MLNEEKKLVSVPPEEGDNEKAAEVSKVDKAIEEKEEILTKLMESIKGYATMKTEFEKLLEAIGALETERVDLETELEKAKKLAANSNNTTNEAAVERIKERFLKVKDELKRMKDERNNKENAYRVMQRESKKVGDMQREVNKLKEMRVTLMKQQKQQSLQLQKMKKEQSVKLSNMKKTDLKKQRLMNNLKSELVKKERVLGHKDREISRINSKLKACEDHISQLLKIQHKNRSKIPQAGSSATNDAKGSLSSADYEHLVSSKSMLDNLIVDRLEKRRVKLQYDKKSAALLELNKELQQEASELESLVSRKAVVKSELRQMRQSVTDAPVSTIKSRSVQFQQQGQNEDEEDDDLLFDNEDTNAVLTADELELRAEYKETIELMSQCEANIDRISRELDLYNADLDSLSQRIDKNTRELKENSDTWEMLGKEIVAGLSMTQAQSIIWDILNEKSDSMERLQQAEEALDTCQENVDQLTEQTQELEKQLIKTDSLMQERLLAAEKQRSQDVWALLRANASGVSAESESTAVQVAVARAQELETELEIFVANEELLKTQLNEATSSLSAISEKFSKQSLINDCASSGDSFQTGSVTKLTDLWTQIGISTEEMQSLAQNIRSSSQDVYTKAVEHYTNAVTELMASIAEREMDYFVLCRVAGRQEPDATSNDSQSLNARLDGISDQCKEVAMTVAARIFPVTELKDQLLDLISEMWLGINDVSEDLKVLMKLSIVRSWSKTVTDLSTAEVSEVIDIAHQLDVFGYQLNDATLAKWTDSLRKLNIKRGTTTNKLLKLRESAAALCGELKLSEKDILQSLFDSYLKTCNPTSESPEDQVFGNATVSPKAASIIVTATLSHCPSSSLYSSSPSNPPGSEQLLVAAEKLNLLVNSVSANRSIVSSHILSIENGLLVATGEVTLSAAAQTPIVSFESLNSGLVSLLGVKSVCVQALSKQCTMLNRLIEEGKGTASSFERDGIIESILRNCYTSYGSKFSSGAVESIQENVDSLDELSAFLEEQWLAELIGYFAAEWNSPALVHMQNGDGSEVDSKYANMVLRVVGSASGQQLVRYVAYLIQEVASVQTVVDGIKELQKFDSMLMKHVAEMEEFENQSKLNRSKLLSGKTAISDYTYYI
jgi:hypothetical protein